MAARHSPECRASGGNIMARTKRKMNPLVQEESSAPAGRRYKTAAYVRLSAEDGGKPGADTIDGQKALLTSFIESKPDMELVAVFCDNGRTGTDFELSLIHIFLCTTSHARLSAMTLTQRRAINQPAGFGLLPNRR